MLRFVPVKKLSTHKTWCPPAISRSQRWEPRKPAPPDTRIDFSSSIGKFFLWSWLGRGSFKSRSGGDGKRARPRPRLAFAASFEQGLPVARGSAIHQALPTLQRVQQPLRALADARGELMSTFAACARCGARICARRPVRSSGGSCAAIPRDLAAAAAKEGSWIFG